MCMAGSKFCNAPEPGTQSSCQKALLHMPLALTSGDASWHQALGLAGVLTLPGDELACADAVLWAAVTGRWLEGGAEALGAAH